MNFRLVLGSFGLLLCIGVFAAGRDSVSGGRAHDFSEAAAVLNRAIAEKAFPGCTVVVGNEERILWSAAYGYSDYEQSAPVTRRTIYDLASLTKVTGTTTVIMRLAAMGRVDVTESVAHYIPEFAEAGSSEEERAWRGKVTVQDLLRHQGGLASWKPFFRSVDTYAELLRAVIETPLEAEPGTRYRYTDLGFILLGEIAARAGGRPLPQLERDLVFRPLHLWSTGRNLPARMHGRVPPTEKWPDREGFVHGVVHDENARAGEGRTGHAGLFATAEDLAVLARELLRGLDGKSRLFPREVAVEFTRREREDFHRALGWGLASGRDSAGGRLSRQSFGHTGFTGTSIWVDPERKLYVILLANRVHPTRDNSKIAAVRSRLADAVAVAVD